MKTSLVTTKGQVTIPASVRHQLGIHQGDRVGFVYENGKVVILPVIKDIEAAFGLVSVAQSASLDDMEQAIQSRGNEL
ncbi:MAG: AbrB/MazE/SpoVT family DNA-binding domain-containing protein [Mariprofundaceae bacterium]|nr:AbrB/MazE/SpoVT family DNA-binding domain-containing protein [Mariprofundaceae bacterium]